MKRQYWARLENKRLGLSMVFVCIVAEFLIWTNPLASAGYRTGLILQVVALIGLAYGRLWKNPRRQPPNP